MTANILHISDEVAEALRDGRPVVALETTLIAHGLPWPLNLETAQGAEAVIRSAGAVPASIGVVSGRPTIGLNGEQLEKMAQSEGVMKASSRDLAVAVAEKRWAATTVASTMRLAHLAGVRILATGGIGGAHRHDHHWDISADLVELGRTPVAVVCAGAKSILDIPKTLEILETQSVPVIGVGCDEFPAFYVRSSREPVSARIDDPAQVAVAIHSHWQLGGAGLVIAQPLGDPSALESDEVSKALTTAEQQALGVGVRGKDLTPYLLSRLADITEGRTLRANHTLILANAKLAATIAVALSQHP